MGVGFAGEDEVAEVGRVEGSAEESDTFKGHAQSISHVNPHINLNTNVTLSGVAVCDIRNVIKRLVENSWRRRPFLRG